MHFALGLSSSISFPGILQFHQPHMRSPLPGLCTCCSLCLSPQLSPKSLLLTILHMSNDISSETPSQVPLSRLNEPPFTSSHSTLPLFFTVNRIQWTYFLHIYLGDQGLNLVHHWLSSMCPTKLSIDPLSTCSSNMPTQLPLNSLPLLRLPE